MTIRIDKTVTLKHIK